MIKIDALFFNIPLTGIKFNEGYRLKGNFDRQSVLNYLCDTYGEGFRTNDAVIEHDTWYLIERRSKREQDIVILANETMFQNFVARFNCSFTLERNTVEDTVTKIIARYQMRQKTPSVIKSIQSAISGTFSINWFEVEALPIDTQHNITLLYPSQQYILKFFVFNKEYTFKV